MRSDVPKHFDSVLHRHDPDIPEKDTDEYYVILNRSFTKPDPTDILYVTKEDDLTVIECQGCENIFVPGPGYDEHIKVTISTNNRIFIIPNLYIFKIRTYLYT